MTMPEWIAVGTADTSGTTSTVPAYGTNIAGDTFVMIVTGRITAFTTPTGWTLQGGPNDQGGRRVYILTRDTRSTGAESGTVTVTLTANSQVATIHTWRGVALSSFVEDVTNAGSAANGSTLTAPTIDAGGNARCAMFVSASGTPITYIEVTGETGGDWRLRQQLSSLTGSNCDYGLFTAIMPVGGTISGGTATITSIDEHSIVGLALVGDATDGTPYVVAAGAGVSGTGTLAVPQVSAPSGTRAYIQVFVRSGSGQAPTAPTGWTIIAGPHAGTSGTCRQWVMREDTARTGTESGTLNVTFAAGASQKTARMYAMASDSGATVEDVDVALSTDTPVAMAPVTASTTFRRAVAFVGIDDDNAIAEATGATGGTWSEPFDEYFGGVSTCIQFQTAGLNAGGTITGGSAVMSGTDDAIVSSFAIVGVSSGLTLSAIPSGEAFGTTQLQLAIGFAAIASGEAFGTQQAQHNLSPGSIGSAEVFGTPQVQPNVLPGSIASAETFGTPQVQRTEIVSFSAVASGEAIGAPQVQRTEIVTFSSIASGEAFGGMQVQLGLNFVSIGTGEALGTMVMQLELVFGAVPSGETFGTMQLPLNVLLAAIASAEAFGTLQVQVVYTLTFSAITSAEVIGTMTVVDAGLLQVSFTSVSSGEDFGAMQVVPAPATVTLEGVPSGETFGTMEHQLGLALAGVGSVETFGLTALSPDFALPSISSGEAFGGMRFDLALALAGIPTAEAVPLPTIAQSVALGAIVSGEAFGTTLLQGGTVVVGFVGIGSAQAFGLMLLELEGDLVTVRAEDCGALLARDRVGSLEAVDRVGSLRSR